MSASARLRCAIARNSSSSNEFTQCRNCLVKMGHYSHALWDSPDLQQTSPSRPDQHLWWQQTPQMCQRWHDISRWIRKTECQRNHIRFALYKKLTRAVNAQDWPAGAAVLASIRTGVSVNLVLGVLIVLVTLLGAAS